MHQITKRKEKSFFNNLSQYKEKRKNLIIAGDFNCVLYPHLDRCTKGKPSTNKIESKELPKLLQKLDLTDALPLVEPTSKGSRAWKENQVRQHSYWVNTSSARLDRFYISSDLIQKVSYVRAKPSPHGDHLGVYLLLRQYQKTGKKEATLQYPLQGVLKEEHQRILEKVIPQYMAQNLHWDWRISKISKKMYKTTASVISL